LTDCGFGCAAARTALCPKPDLRTRVQRIKGARNDFKNLRTGCGLIPRQVQVRWLVACATSPWKYRIAAI